jgi:hypothetical protein
MHSGCQVVWKGTRRVGCAFQVCPTAPQWKTIAACEYDPPGNYQDQFPQNVGPLQPPGGETSHFDKCPIYAAAFHTQVKTFESLIRVLTKSRPSVSN